MEPIIGKSDMIGESKGKKIEKTTIKNKRHKEMRFLFLTNNISGIAKIKIRIPAVENVVNNVIENNTILKIFIFLLNRQSQRIATVINVANTPGSQKGPQLRVGNVVIIK